MSYKFEQGLTVLRLYRKIMKAHIKKMPEDLRIFGKSYPNYIL